jgi:hypothetical protein
MSMKGSGGGGFGSKPHVKVPVVNGKGASRIVPGGPAQLGQRQGNHFNSAEGGGTSSSYGGINPFAETLRGLGTQPLGNEVAATTKCGVGGSRTIYKSGSQMGLTDRSIPQGREIFQGFSGRK